MQGDEPQKKQPPIPLNEQTAIYFFQEAVRFKQGPNGRDYWNQTPEQLLEDDNVIWLLSEGLAGRRPDLMQQQMVQKPEAPKPEAQRPFAELAFDKFIEFVLGAFDGDKARAKRELGLKNPRKQLREIFDRLGVNKFQGQTPGQAAFQLLAQRRANLQQVKNRTSQQAAWISAIDRIAVPRAAPTTEEPAA